MFLEDCPKIDVLEIKILDATGNSAERIDLYGVSLAKVCYETMDLTYNSNDILTVDAEFNYKRAGMISSDLTT